MLNHLADGLPVPACGSWPALAEFFFGERLLRCAFCACTWRQAVNQCAFCHERWEHFATVVPDREQPGRRIELCQSAICNLQSSI